MMITGSVTAEKTYTFQPSPTRKAVIIIHSMATSTAILEMLYPFTELHDPM
ncbi:MAG: hypothetical protein P0Y53_12230 [Candidatus Pseudobacter hemicellulosilyticus]|uniref:Uncharacterized protein n=1 Tax=Candidatus Pseudobacter hemicellulosilyticus TaxID=3121375 RepID=A0AAJ5WW44_9BACT|nr:MAG: hypothetical protein P0Y53_12230 [Pseudobacter sp.]